MFFVSSDAARHSKNIETRSSLAVAVFDSNQGWDDWKTGLQLFGTCAVALWSRCREWERSCTRRDSRRTRCGCMGSAERLGTAARPRSSCSSPNRSKSSTKRYWVKRRSSRSHCHATERRHGSGGDGGLGDPVDVARRQVGGFRSLWVGVKPLGSKCLPTGEEAAPLGATSVRSSLLRTYRWPNVSLLSERFFARVAVDFSTDHCRSQGCVASAQCGPRRVVK